MTDNLPHDVMKLVKKAYDNINEHAFDDAKTELCAVCRLCQKAILKPIRQKKGKKR